MKDLTNSNIYRQNILNNRFATERIQEYIGLAGMLFKEEYRFSFFLFITNKSLIFLEN